MANTKKSHGFIAEQVLAGDAIPIWTGLLASNQIIGKGDPLRATTGYVLKYVTAPGDKSVLGVALSAQATSAGTHPTVYFVPAVDWVVFSGQCSGNLTQGEIWTTCDVEVSAMAEAGKAEVNEDATTNDEIYIIGVKGSSALGTYGEALFLWAKSKFTGKITTLS